VRVTTYADPAAFAAVAVPRLMRDEAANCLPLGIIDTLLNDPRRYPTFHLMTVDEGPELQGVAWMTPPHPLGLSAMPSAAVVALLQYALTLREGVPSVLGPKPVVDEFKALWLSRTGCSRHSTREQRIYRLDQVAPAPPVPGELRVSTEEDLDWLTEWSHAFVTDCGLSDSPEAVRVAVLASVRAGNRVFWASEGLPVSMAGYGGRTPSGVRINWVYTPPEQRRQGYASALVAALSQKLLFEGRRFCFLYTDLANPTSNSIYQRIGYKPACDCAHHTFGS